MPKCGYHPRMGVGLREIGAGLADAVHLKASLHSRSVGQQLTFEQEEFTVVREVVRRKMTEASNPGEQQTLEAFESLLCLAEFLLNLRNTTEVTDLPSEIGHRTELFISFLRRFDDVWKGQLLDKSIIDRAENALRSSMAERRTVNA